MRARLPIFTPVSVWVQLFTKQKKKRKIARHKPPVASNVAISRLIGFKHLFYRHVCSHSHSLVTKRHFTSRGVNCWGHWPQRRHVVANIRKRHPDFQFSLYIHLRNRNSGSGIRTPVSNFRGFAFDRYNENCRSKSTAKIVWFQFYNEN